MTRENFNRYENDKNRSDGRKKEKRLRSPVSKGSRRNQEKQDLQRAIDRYTKGDDHDEE